MHYYRMNKLESAIIFAVEKHAGAVRKGTELPYIIHPLEALTIASGICAKSRDVVRDGDDMWNLKNDLKFPGIILLRRI